MSRALIAQYLLGIIAMVAFAYVASYYPQYNTQLIIGYFILMTLIMFAFTGKQAGQMMKDLQEIQAAEVIYKIRRETVAKLREKDFHLLKDEMAGQWKSMLVGFIPLILIMVVFYVPPLRDIFFSVGKMFSEEERMANFISFLFLYGIFYIFTIPMSMVNMRKQATRGTLSVANEYVVTEKGVIVDNRLPIRFPIQGKVEVNSRRKFIEIHTMQSTMGMNVKTKIRLYTPEPGKLAKLIREKSALADRSGGSTARSSGKS